MMAMEIWVVKIMSDNFGENNPYVSLPRDFEISNMILLFLNKKKNWLENKNLFFSRFEKFFTSLYLTQR